MAIQVPYTYILQYVLVHSQVRLLAECTGIFGTLLIIEYSQVSVQVQGDGEISFLNMVATPPLFLFISSFGGARAEDRTRGCLTGAPRATCRLRRHPTSPGVAT